MATSVEPSMREGTVSFWIEPRKVNFADSSVVLLTRLAPPDGTMFIAKDQDRKLKVHHISFGQGRTDVEYDVSNLNPAVRHMVAVTWDAKKRDLILYLDGHEVARAQMSDSAA